MKFKALISPLALVSALALTGGASAQSMMIGEQTIADENEMAQVKNFCRDLLIEELNADPGEIAGANDDVAEENTGIADLTTNINFDTITVEQCETTFADMIGEDGMMLDDAMMEEEVPQG